MRRAGPGARPHLCSRLDGCLCWRLRFLDRRRRWRWLLNCGSGLLRWRLGLRSGRVGLRFLRSDGLLRGWLLLCRRRLSIGSGRVGLGGRLLGGRIRLGCGLLWLWLFVAHILFPSNQRPRSRFAQKFACGFQISNVAQLRSRP